MIHYFSCDWGSVQISEATWFLLGDSVKWVDCFRPQLVFWKATLHNFVEYMAIRQSYLHQKYTWNSDMNEHSFKTKAFFSVSMYNHNSCILKLQKKDYEKKLFKTINLIPNERLVTIVFYCVQWHFKNGKIWCTQEVGTISYPCGKLDGFNRTELFPSTVNRFAALLRPQSLLVAAMGHSICYGGFMWRGFQGSVAYYIRFGASSILYFLNCTRTVWNTTFRTRHDWYIFGTDLSICKYLPLHWYTWTYTVKGQVHHYLFNPGARRIYSSQYAIHDSMGNSHITLLEQIIGGKFWQKIAKFLK